MKKTKTLADTADLPKVAADGSVNGSDTGSETHISIIVNLDHLQKVSISSTYLHFHIHIRAHYRFSAFHVHPILTSL